MLGYLAVAFIVIPIVELWLLIRVGSLIGPVATILIVIGTGMTGAYLARLEGLRAWMRFNETLQKGELPGREMLDAFLLFLAAALLITPGILTDIAGFVLLFGPTRRLVRAYIGTRLATNIHVSGTGFPPPGGFDPGREEGPQSGQTINVDYEVEDEGKK